MKNLFANCSKKLLTLLIFLLFSLNIFAQPDLAGEITWKIVPMGQPNAGKFIFKYIYYKSCTTTAGDRDSILIHSNSPAGNFYAYLIPNYPKNYPNCSLDTSLNHLNCSNASFGSAKEYVFLSNPILLNGIPPSSGWKFYTTDYGNKLLSTNLGMYAPHTHSIMFPYAGVNCYPGFDSSPEFKSSPYIIVNGGYDANYNPLGKDIDLDSLTYEWAPILSGTNGSVKSFNSGYSFQTPLPDSSENQANSQVFINSQNGEISFKSYTTGLFYACQKVTSYKCGQKVAEIYRELCFFIKDTNSNRPPTISTATICTIDTVFAGELVNFNIQILDSQLQSNGVAQNVSYEYFSSQFGSYLPAVTGSPATLSPTYGCLNPPCATLTPASTSQIPIIGSQVLNVNLSWQTDYDHLHTNMYCGVTTNTYNFIFKVTDDYCPLPAFHYQKYRIVVEKMPIIDPPMINYINVDSANGISLAWDTIIDSLSIFNHYDVYYSDSLNSSFQLLGSTTSNSYHHNIINPYSRHLFYYILPVGIGCVPIDTIAPLIDTAVSIYLHTNNLNIGFASLSWNQIVPNTTILSGSYFKIYRKFSFGNWILIDSTQSHTYNDTIAVCGDTVSYKIGVNIVTNMGRSCNESFSNISSGFYRDVIPPDMPIIDTVIIDTQTANATIIWFPNQRHDVIMYIVYKNENQVFTPIDTVIGYNNTTYIDTSNTLSNMPNITDYAVAAIDSCGNQCPFSYYIGIKNTDKELALKLYPNPVEDMLYFSFDNSEQYKGILEIFNMEGKTVLHKSINDNIIVIDISSYNKGSYIYNLKLQNGLSKSGSFIKK